MAKNEACRIAGELTDVINAWRRRLVWDKDLGGVMPHNWGVRKSGGADVLQVITESRPSKLEQRSSLITATLPESEN